MQNLFLINRQNEISTLLLSIIGGFKYVKVFNINLFLYAIYILFPICSYYYNLNISKI